MVVVVNFLDAFVSLMCGAIEVRYLAYVKQSFLLCMQIRLQTSNGLFSCDSMYLLTKEYITILFYALYLGHVGDLMLRQIERYTRR